MRCRASVVVRETGHAFEFGEYVVCMMRIYPAVSSLFAYDLISHMNHPVHPSYPSR